MARRTHYSRHAPSSGPDARQHLYGGREQAFRSEAVRRWPPRRAPSPRRRDVDDAHEPRQVKRDRYAHAVAVSNEQRRVEVRRDSTHAERLRERRVRPGAGLGATRAPRDRASGRDAHARGRHVHSPTPSAPTSRLPRIGNWACRGRGRTRCARRSMRPAAHVALGRSVARPRPHMAAPVQTIAPKPGCTPSAAFGTQDSCTELKLVRGCPEWRCPPPRRDCGGIRFAAEVSHCVPRASDAARLTMPTAV